VAIAVQTWRDGIDNGRDFGAALGEWVPPGERMILHAAAGDIIGALDNIIRMNAEIARMRKAIISSAGEPIKNLGGALVMLVLFGMFLIPQFTTIMPRGYAWRGFAGVMVALSEFLQFWGIPIVVLLVLSAVAFVIAAPRWTGPLRVVADRFPPFSFYRLWHGSSVLLALGALQGAGVPLHTGLEQLEAGAARSPWLLERIAATRHHVENGKNLGEAFVVAGHGFPDPALARDLRIFARLPTFQRTLVEMSRFWVKASVDKVEKQGAALKLVAMVIAGLVIGGMTWGVVDLQMQVNDSLQVQSRF
jgi:type II secretory pathway component PulF